MGQKPYVRYYEITPHFNGNTKPTQNLLGSGDFREWGKVAWSPLQPYSNQENEIYFLGSGAYTYPNPDNYLGIFDNNLNWREQGLHGTVILSVNTFFEYPDRDFTAEEIYNTEKAMREFTQSYIDGWTFTVKPVS